ncbi:MAG: hypothetical protein FWF43_05120 [Propionibacteriaceae bacterium]|nr:hypothetical protein [Propionibacteriaceae bacterium]
MSINERSHFNRVGDLPVREIGGGVCSPDIPATSLVEKNHVISQFKQQTTVTQTPAPPIIMPIMTKRGLMIKEETFSDHAKHESAEPLLSQ